MNQNVDFLNLPIVDSSQEGGQLARRDVDLLDLPIVEADEPIQAPKIESEFSKKIGSLDKKIEESEKFDQSFLGKALSFLPGENTTEILKKKRDRLASQEERGLTTGQKIKEDVVEAGKEIIGDTARFAAFAIPLGKAPKALSAAGKAAVQAGKQSGIISGSKFVEELSKGDDVEESAKTALKAGVSGGAVALGLPLAFKSGKKVAELLSPAIKVGKKGLAAVSEAFNSVPQEMFERALDKELKGQSIFKGKWSLRVFNSIGKKAQSAINFVKKEAGKEVGEEVAALKGSKQTINAKGIISKIDDMIEQRAAGGETSLEKKDLKIINDIKNKLITDLEMNVGKANIIKRQINNKVKFQTETVKTPSSEGQGILKQVAKDINDSIADVVPKYREVNEKFSKVSNLQDRLKSQLKDVSVERNVRNLFNDKTSKFSQELFEELDEIAPKNLKFIEQLKDSVARAPFEEWFPGRGGGSGGPQGIANFLRLGSLTVKPFLAPAFSPKVAQKGVQAVGLARQSKPAIQRGLPPLVGLSTGDNNE